MYNQKSKEATMKYLATLKEIRFRVKPDEYKSMQEFAQSKGYKSMRQFYLDSINTFMDNNK